MGKSVLALLLSCFFLAGGLLFPLSDFSLMKELPDMYRSYTKIVVEEADVLDFIGDYILNGKDLLGHNQYDAVPKADRTLQFQRQANAMLMFFWPVKTASVILVLLVKKPVFSHRPVFPTSFSNELFRPPLA